MTPSNFTPHELTHKLTSEQLRDGWTVTAHPGYIMYKNPEGKIHDPAPGVPALQEWHLKNNGRVRSAKRTTGYFKDGLLHNPSCETPAKRSWHRDGTLWSEAHYTCGALVHERYWNRRGEIVISR